jgi:hypothetical protein
MKVVSMAGKVSGLPESRDLDYYSSCTMRSDVSQVLLSSDGCKNSVIFYRFGCFTEPN